MMCDHSWGGRLRSQRAFDHPFLGLKVDDAVFFRVSDFTEGNLVDVGIFCVQQEEQQGAQAEGPGKTRHSNLGRKRQATCF